MRRRCLSVRFVGVAVLRDHRLVFTRRSINRGCGVADGIRYRLHEAKRDFERVAYANIARLKQPAENLFARMQRP